MTTNYTAETCPTQSELYQQIPSTEIQRFNETLTRIINIIKRIRELDSSDYLETIEFEFDYADISYSQVCEYLRTK
jgi:hypothetical protein